MAELPLLGVLNVSQLYPQVHALLIPHIITSSSRLELLTPVISLLRNLMALYMLADRGRH